MSAGIQHLLKGGKESNRIGEARVDKLEADGFNSIVERISGVNPSKIAATVTGAKVEAAPQRPRAAPPQLAAGPGPSLGSKAPWEESSGGNATVDQLARQVALLEQRLAKYEVFNANDNDVVSTTTTPAAKLNRGADSSAYGSGSIRKKNAKSKDPVDGKPDKQTEPNMAGERVNILGVSMDEWRSLAGLSAPVLKAPAIVESTVEDEFEEDEVAAPAQSTNEHALWAQFLSNYDTTPEAFAEFAEAASENDDEDAILAIQALEDEFIEAIGAEPDAPIEEDIDRLWSQWLEARDLSVETFNALVDAAETEEDVATLESLQSMFEAEIAGKRIAGSDPTPGGDKEVTMPGQKPQKLTSLAHGQIKPSRKGNFSLPASMRAKMGLPKEEDEDVFECDDDGTGGPDMKHPGWAKAMSKFKKSGRKS